VMRPGGGRTGLGEAQLRQAWARKLQRHCQRICANWPWGYAWSNEDLIVAEAIREVNARFERRFQPASDPRPLDRGRPRGFVGQTSDLARLVGYSRRNNVRCWGWILRILSIAKRL